MPTIQDFVLSYENGNITLGLNPPVPIGGMTLQFSMYKRYGTISLVTKSMSSGYYNVSGMNVLNSGQGILQIQLNPQEVSGFDQGAYFYQVKRTDSGSATIMAEGYRLLF